MAIGLGLLRAAGRGRRAGRTEEDRGPTRTTVREVCLIGLDRRASGGDWTTGQEVAWLGRTYRVVAAAGESSEPLARAGGAEAGPGRATARRYVHLSQRGGD
jgi:hypothetical protein